MSCSFLRLFYLSFSNSFLPNVRSHGNAGAGGFLTVKRGTPCLVFFSFHALRAPCQMLGNAVFSADKIHFFPIPTSPFSCVGHARHGPETSDDVRFCRTKLTFVDPSPSLCPKSFFWVVVLLGLWIPVSTDISLEAVSLSAFNTA